MKLLLNLYTLWFLQKAHQRMNWSRKTKTNSVLLRVRHRREYVQISNVFSLASWMDISLVNACYKNSLASVIVFIVVDHQINDPSIYTRANKRYILKLWWYYKRVNYKCVKKKWYVNLLNEFYFNGIRKWYSQHLDFNILLEKWF